MWVPGHADRADIGGNDVADALAKRGARGISSDQAPPATAPHIYVPAPSQACSLREEKEGQVDPSYSRPTATPPDALRGVGGASVKENHAMGHSNFAPYANQDIQTAAMAQPHSQVV